MKKSPNTVYIGYDPKENTAYEVLKFTIERIAVDNVRVVPIRRDVVERMGMYTREFDVVDGQTIDKIDGLSLIHISSPRDRTRSRMPSSA